MSQCQNFPKRIKVFKELCISFFIHYFSRTRKDNKTRIDPQYMFFLENILFDKQIILLLVYSKTSRVAYQDHSI